MMQVDQIGIPSNSNSTVTLQQNVLAPAEQVPSELNPSVVGHGIVMERDRLTIRYTGDSRHSNDVGAVQANKPVPRKRLIYYYEVLVLNEGLKGKIAVGFAEKNFKLNRQPGWEPGSYGYHGDDGKKYHQTGTGEDYGPRFGTGDVIGAGINLNKAEMFFTKNGVRLKTAFRNVHSVLYPTVGLHSKNESVEFNFGTKPFRFDLQGLISEERAALHETISSQVSVPPHAALNLVAEYLGHWAYADTLKALLQQAGEFQEPITLAGVTYASPSTAQEGVAGDLSTMSTSSASAWLTIRQQTRLAIISGDLDKAIELLRNNCPQVWGVFI